MAKASTIEGLDCDGVASTAAVEILRVRFAEILAFHPAAMQSDGVDGVHDMRVASRRFRSAFRDFAPLFEKKTAKPLKKQVKGVSDALGDVRDIDVSIDAMTSMVERAPNETIASSIRTLIEARRARRSETHKMLLKKVTPQHLEQIRNDLEELLIKSPHSHSDQTFRLFAVGVIGRAEQKFLERSQSIYRPLDDKALHKLRLSAKRLRYALELFNACWGGELKPVAKHLSRIQSSLGEVHDSSEWIEYLGRKLEDQELDRQAAAWLIAELFSHRTDEYVKALDLIGEFLALQPENRLRSIIEK